MSTSKPWERPWSMDEIIENSDKWNLAGDVALLNTLKAFADNMLTKTTEINNNLHNLTNNLDETSLKLNLAQNEFFGLRNTQFIESRVYEDDESIVKTESKPKTEEKSEIDKTEDIRQAALKGLEVLEKYFDKVEVSVSDSEDEDIDLPNYVLRPKDLYIDRPLPYVIGSDEWHKSWHVGLEDSSSDSETEKVSDKFSESDSDADLPVTQDQSQIKETSDTSSDLDFPQKRTKEFFNSSDSENSVPVHAPVSNFAEQLADKLGHVVTQDYQEPEINRRPIQPTRPNYGDIFFDEPPPLDEPKGLFSGGRGLFDDEDDDQGPSYSTPKEPKIESKSGGLFDEADSDNDMFSKKKQQTVEAPLFINEPPALNEEKKPIGGVSILGGGNLFDKKLLRRPPSSDDDDDDDDEEEANMKKKVDLFSDDKLFDEKLSIKNETISKKVNLFDSDDKNSLFGDTKSNEKIEDKKLIKNEETEKSEQKISLFDDEDDPFKSDLFSSTNTKKFTSGLFDDIPGDDLFATKDEEKPKPSGSIFDDLMAIPDNKNSINVDTKVESSVSTDETEKSNLFSASPTKEFDDGNKSESKPKLGLFDSPPPSPDDLFSSSPPQINATAAPSMRLFDSSPPPDNEWDTKSEDISENDDFVNDFEESASNTNNLFTEEPPSLDFKKPGKLKHNLNINVGALMPGSLPPKRGDNVPKTSENVINTSPTNVANRLLSDVANTSPINVNKTSLGNVPATSFDETDRVEVLHSVTKDRARVPLNRRPSTRRGRKAALENTGSDFKFSQEKEEIETTKSDRKEEIERKTNISSDDLFSTKGSKTFDSNKSSKREDSGAEETEEKKISGKNTPPLDTKAQKRKSALFDSGSNDLFGIKPIKNENEEGQGKKESGLFDSDGDLFGAKSAQSSFDDLFGSKVNPAKDEENEKQSSLFEEPPDEDLFEVLQKNQPKAGKKTGFLFEAPENEDIMFPKSSPPKTENFKAGPSTSQQFEAKMSEELFEKGVSSKSEDFQEKSAKPSAQVKSGLFDDEDDDDDLFSNKKMTVQSTKSKKSLFDDEDNDDDDIFKSFSSARVKKVDTKVATEKKIPKVSSVKKLQNTKPEDDPLSALLK